MHANYEHVRFTERADEIWPKVKAKTKQEKRRVKLHKGERYKAWLANLQRIRIIWRRNDDLQLTWKLKWQTKQFERAQDALQERDRETNPDTGHATKELKPSETLWQAGAHNTPVRPDVLEATIQKHAPPLTDSAYKTAGLAPGFTRATDVIEERQKIASLVSDMRLRTKSGKPKTLPPLKNLRTSSQ